MKKAFTLIEIIVTIVILGILAAGTFVSLKHLYLRSAKSKILSESSFTTQIVVDQIAALLYDRVPATVIGYKLNGDFEPIANILSTDFKILQWIGTSVEAHKSGYYSGFIDLDASDKNTSTAVSFEIDGGDINASFKNKFGRDRNADDIALIFAGSFDDASLSSSSDFNSSFGWHGNPSNLIYTFTTSDNNLSFDIKPQEVYEKYYLVDSAYAIARKEDITPPCSSVDASDDANTLYLFYNFRPWKAQDFCDGNVTVLAEGVRGFKAGVINNNIYFSLSISKEIRGSDNNLSISKEKVVF